MQASSTAPGQPAETTRWRRLSPRSLVSLILPKSFSPMNLWPLAAMAALVFQHDLWLKLNGAQLILVVASGLLIWLAVGLLQYWHFRYRIDPEGLRVRQGVLLKSEVFVQFSRVQGIALQRGPVFRLLGLVTLALETAGSNQQEGQLPGIHRYEAEEIRLHVQRIRDKLDQGQQQAETTNHTIPTNAAPHTESAGQVMLRMDADEIIREGMTSGHMVLMLTLLGVVLQPLTDDLLKEWRLELMADSVNWYHEVSITVLLLVVSAMLIGLALVLLLMSVTASFLRFHRFELIRSGEQLRSRAGLLTVREQTINREKIQTVTIRQSLLRRWIKRIAVDLRQAGIPSGKKGADGMPAQNQMLVPLAPPAFQQAIARFAFDGFSHSLHKGDQGEQSPPPLSFARISPRYCSTRILMLGLLPALLVSAYLVWSGNGGLKLMLPAAWLVLVCAVTALRYHRWGVVVDDDIIGIRSGWLGQRTDWFACHKIQRIDLQTTPWHEYRQVAHLTIHLASSNLSVPYLRLPDAVGLRDYLLYKTESSDRFSF